MSARWIELSYGPECQLLYREEFRDKFRRGLEKELMDIGESWSHQLASVPFGEIVKNFYDHANKQGFIVVMIAGNEIRWVAHDYGPGDREGRTVDIIIEQNSRDRKKYKNSATDGNCGLGLGLIKGSLDSLKKCPGVKESTWSLKTDGRFKYQGHIILAE